jgi:hypothetical protein
VIRARFLNLGYDFQAREGRQSGISISGHALFSKPGEDIVCAAVSSLAHTALLSIERQCGDIQAVHQESGELKSMIDTSSLDKDGVIILKAILVTLYTGLSEIERQYPDRIKIEFEDNEASA